MEDRLVIGFLIYERLNTFLIIYNIFFEHFLMIMSFPNVAIIVLVVVVVVVTLV